MPDPANAPVAAGRGDRARRIGPVLHPSSHRRPNPTTAPSLRPRQPHTPSRRTATANTARQTTSRSYARSCQTRTAQPITTNETIAARHRNASKLSTYLARAIERLVGHPAPEAYAFWGSATTRPKVTEIIRNDNPVGKRLVDTQTAPQPRLPRNPRVRKHSPPPRNPACTARPSTPS
jgi:hypothetical protein